MSFYIGLLLVVPEEEEVSYLMGPPTKKTLWRVEHVLDLSTLKADPKEEGFAGLPKKFRARTFLLDLLWPPLSRYLDKGEFELAPKFAVYDDDLQKWPQKFPTDVVMPWRKDPQNPIPSYGVMDAHNGALKRGDQPRCEKDLRQIGSPLMWIHTHKLLEMIESTEGETLERLKADIGAYAYFSVWRAMFREFGRIGGHVIIPMGLPASDCNLHGA